MGSFPGHAISGTLFLVIGVWHMRCSLIRYASNPKSFRVRVWNPVPGFDGRLKYLELYVIAVGVFFDLCIEFLYSTHLKIVVHGVLNPSHMNDFEHSAMLLMFFLLGAVAILSEKTSYLPLSEGSLCFVTSAVFTAEYLLFYFHSPLTIGLCILSTISFHPPNRPLYIVDGCWSSHSHQLPDRPMQWHGYDAPMHLVSPDNIYSIRSRLGHREKS